mgnify:CR=1 FL=1
MTTAQIRQADIDRICDDGPDWLERKTAELLRAAKRCGYFADVIDDAKLFATDGFTWDVALAKSLEYWGR